MQVTIQNNKSPANELNGRYYKTFTPQSAQELIKIHHLGCVGNTEVSDIQLEKGNTPTAFVAPTVTQTPTAGILNDLRSLNLQLTNPNSELWGKIRATSQGLLTEFKNSEMQSALGITSNSIMQQVNSLLNGNFSSFEQRLNSLKSTVKQEAVTSTVEQLGDRYTTQIAGINNKVTQYESSLDGIRQSVQEVDRKSEVTITSNGITFGSGKTVNGQALASMIAVNPDNVQVITKKMKVDGDMIVDGAITADKIAANTITGAEIAAGSITSTKLATGAISADKVSITTGFIQTLVSSDAFITNLFSDQVTAQKVKAALLEGYKGIIGGFSIGPHAKWGGHWITGANAYSVGLSNGERNNDDGVALFVNWGRTWDEPGGNAWYVKEDGHMYCNNVSTFNGTAYFTANTEFGARVDISHDLEVGSDIVLRGAMYVGTNNGTRLKIHDSNVEWGSQHVLWSEPSDSRLKTNIKKSTTKGLDIINQLEMVQFDWKNSGKHERLGVIAQQAIKHIPHMAKISNNYYTVDYSKVVPFLIKAVQELSERIDKYEQQA